ncbi:MAG: hypothetical protein RMI91_10520 [Gemmatales bacterium]|nr:hypothetical protein [Gemmatales bacterium]MDW7995076.1 hypothetical protein [Gemmatales bacterium]
MNWRYLVYPLLEQARSLGMERVVLWRWIAGTWQASLQALSCAAITALAWQAFGSRVVALVAMVLSSLHPWWLGHLMIVDDRALIQCLISNWLTVILSTVGTGGVIGPLAVGLLSGALLVLRPGTLVALGFALVWYLWRLRLVARGWLAALIVVLALTNFLATWFVRHWWDTGEVIPLAAIFWQKLYEGLPVASEPLNTPAELSWRETAGLVTRTWRQSWPAWWQYRMTIWSEAFRAHRSAPLLIPAWLSPASLDTYLMAGQLLFLAAVLLGWRWSFAWFREHRPMTWAAIFLPLAYAWGNSASLSEGLVLAEPVFLVYASLAVTGMIPWLGSRLFAERHRFVSEVPQESAGGRSSDLR